MTLQSVPTIDTLWKSGDLAGAIRATEAVLAAAPGDTQKRYLLAEFLCFAGELERADAELESCADQDTSLAVSIQQLRQVIRAATARHEVFRNGRPPEFLDGTPGADLSLRLRALTALRAGAKDDARQLIEEAEAARQPVQVIWNGDEAAEMRDVDDLTAGLIEIMTSTGRYFWVPLHRVTSLELEAPKRPLDLLWRRARISVSGGPDGEVWLPALYAGIAEEPDAELRLGRATDYVEDQGPVLARGGRCYLVGEELQPLLELRSLKLAEAA